MRALVFAMLIVFAVACGENVPPTVQDIRASNPTVQSFQEFFITLISVEDPDGNVYGGRVKVNAKGKGEELDGEVTPFEGEPEKSRGDVIFGVNLTGDLPLGAWKFEVIFEDEGGAEADPLFTTVDLTL